MPSLSEFIVGFLRCFERNGDLGPNEARDRDYIELRWPLTLGEPAYDICMRKMNRQAGAFMSSADNSQRREGQVMNSS